MPICTLVALVVTLIALPFGLIEASSPWLMSLVMAFTGIVSLPVVVYLNAFMARPLQKASLRLCGKVITLYRQDVSQRITSTLLYANPLICLFFAIMLMEENLPLKPFFICLWILWIGFSLDLAHAFTRRAYRHIDATELLPMLEDTAKREAAQGIEEAIDWIDAMTEVAANGEANASPRTTLESARAIHTITKAFLDAQPAIGSSSELVNYTVIYALQRLLTIYQGAQTRKQEMVTKSVVAAIGKMTTTVAAYDFALAAYPLNMLREIGMEGLASGSKETALTVSYTLQEVARMVVEGVPLSGAQIASFFVSLTNHLDDIGKATFKADKATNLQLLIQPFRELLTLVDHASIVSHPDRAAILDNLNRVIEEYGALAHVLTNINRPAKKESPPSQDGPSLG